MKKNRLAANTATFDALVRSICLIHDKLSSQAARAVNVSFTLRNWFIGMHISEFELHGAGRAVYGEKLFTELAAKLAKHNITGCRSRQLYNYRDFYRIYPQISRTVSAKSERLAPAGFQPNACKGDGVR